MATGHYKLVFLSSSDVLIGAVTCPGCILLKDMCVNVGLCHGCCGYKPLGTLSITVRSTQVLVRPSWCHTFLICHILIKKWISEGCVPFVCKQCRLWLFWSTLTSGSQCGCFRGASPAPGGLKQFSASGKFSTEEAESSKCSPWQKRGVVGK